MAALKIYTTVKSRLPLLPLLDGQLIFCSDNNTIYLDQQGLRIPYNLLQVLESDEQRESIDAEPGFYFVEDTCTLWRYSDSWTPILGGDSPSGGDNIMFVNSEDDLPEHGSKKVLYVSDIGVYKWKNGEYQLVANKSEWKDIKENG